MPRVQDVLRFKDKGTSVEDARKKMLEAGEAPSGVAGEVKKNAAAGFAPPIVAPAVLADALEPVLEEMPVEKVPAASPAAVPAAAVEVTPAVPPVPEKQKIERIETGEFIAEIRQEKGDWVGEIKYKSGAGTERFSASTKNELMLELLKGKGHATLRVKQAVRREKLGGPKLDKGYPLPEGFTTEEFSELPAKQQDLVIETIAAQQAQLFCSLRPEYHQTEKNSEQLQEFLKKHNLPITLRNLEYAFEDLTEDGLLEVKEEQTPASPAAEKVSATPSPAPRAEDSASAAPSPAPASPAPIAAEASAVTVRKRGTSGLQPGQSSLPSGSAGGGTDEKSRDLSEAELRKLPMSELKRIADADRRARGTVQR